MSRSKFNAVSFSFIVFSFLLSAISLISPSEASAAASGIHRLLYSAVFPSLLSFTGYFIGINGCTLEKEKLKKCLVSTVSVYGIAVGVCLFIFFFIKVSAGNTDILPILKDLVFVVTKGFPSQLWFVPAVLLSVPVIYFSRKYFSLKITGIVSAAIFALSAVLLNFSPLFPGRLYSVNVVLHNIFGGSHTGVFSAVFFICIGIYFAERKKSGNKFISFIGVVLSSALLFAENQLLSDIGGNTDTYFCFSSVPLIYSLLSFILSFSGELESVDSKFLTVFGRSFLLFSQCVTAVAFFSVYYEKSIFSKFFINESVRLEFVLFFAVFFTLFYCAYKSDSEDIITAFIVLLQKTVLNMLYIPAAIISRLGTKIKNAVCIISFAALPVLLWFIERQIKYSLCCDVFAVCLVLIFLCSLDKRTEPAAVSKKFFAGFFVVSSAIYLTSVIYSASVFTDIGRMMLFFFLPLGTEIAGDKENISRLIKNYTYGLYVSFAIFFFYCACFRPYDITRYKGAFCNANMCGLYLVAVCLAALCALPAVSSLKEILKKPLHFIVFGTSFAFTAFTISRTAAVGIAAAVAVKFAAEYFSFDTVRKKDKDHMKKALLPAVAVVLSMTAGLVISYAAIRCIPAVVDNPIFLLVEYTDTYEYKVKPGESFFSENYISPLRFFQAWFDRSFVSYENINELSTGRIDIYTQYLKSISLQGHSALRIPVEATGEVMFAHNVLLQLAFNCGLPAGLGFGLLGLAALADSLKKRLFGKKHLVFAAVAVASYFSCGMFESMECFYYPLLFSALTGFMIFAVSPSEKDSVNAFGFSDDKKTAEITSEQSVRFNSLTVKKILLSALVIVIFAVFIYFVIVSGRSQEGMKLFYQFMG